MISDTKDKILQGAAHIFFTEGFSTGIDRVISECGVAKMTLYQHFKTKEGLICAILKDVQTSLQKEIRREAEINAKNPNAQLEAACLILCEGMNDPELRVGLSIRALLEFPGAETPVHEAARHLDLTILKWFERLCEDAQVPDAPNAARQILHIAKGCFLMAPTVGIEASELIALDLLSSVLAQSEEFPPPHTGVRRSNGHSRSLPAART